MAQYLQACGGVLLGVVLILCLGSRERELGTLLALGICVMVSLIAFCYLEPVIELLRQLEHTGGLNHDMLSILLKTAGIGLVAEIASLICADSGNASLGKAVQILGNAVILWLSVPMFTMLMELLGRILGEL